MKHRSKALLMVLAAVALAGAVAARAEEAHIYLAPHAWFPALDGDGAACSGAGCGFDLADDLEADNTDLHFGLDFLARLGKHRIVLGASNGEHEGDRLNSSVELDRARVFYGYSFVNTGMLDLGVLVGADTYKVTTKAAGGKMDLDSPAPAIGLNLGIRPPVVPLRLYAEAVYSSLEISDVDTTLTDAYVSLDWYLIPVLKTFGVQAGYRYYDLESEDKKNGEKANYKFQGPFAGIVFRF